MHVIKRKIKNLILDQYARRVWTSTIGLEIHAQIAAKSKLFSNAETLFGQPVNYSVNLLDAAIPGALPTVNKQCVELGVLSSHALSCKISPVSHFDRKHYFYADLPCGFQITQQRVPLATCGHINFYVYTPGIHKTPYKKKCGIKQIQLEQDSGKSLHDLDRKISLIDLNRAGIGLLEFVFEPDLHDGEEAAALVKELILILEMLNVCSCKMEEGALRIDANVSISDDPSKFGTRTEIKNIGSIRGVANAIKYEIARQTEIVKTGGVVSNETRGWDPVNKMTVLMREKDDGHDYRFMPEPNIPPLRVCIDDSIKHVSVDTLDLRHALKTLPQLPEYSRVDLMDNYGLSDVHAIMLVNQPQLLTLFLRIMSTDKKRNAKLVWNVLLVQLLNVLNNTEIDASIQMVDDSCLGEIVDLINGQFIDFETCRNILSLKTTGSKLSARHLMDLHNWRLNSNPDKIDAICKELLSRNRNSVKKVKKGKIKALQTIVNDTVNITSEKLNMRLVAQRLKELIDEQ